MADAEGRAVPNLLGVALNWVLDYCMYNIWRNFSAGERHVSGIWLKTVIDIQRNGIEQENVEISEKFCCIKFICGLCKVLDTEKKQSDAQILQQCMSTLDKVMESYPFSTLEKSCMHGGLKLQIVLAEYRCGRKDKAKILFHKFYNGEGQEDEDQNQEEIRNLFEPIEEAAEEAFLRKHTYEKFLQDTAKFLTPFWDKFDVPLLQEEYELFQNMEEDKINFNILKAIHDGLDESEDTEESWIAIVKGTHPDIVALKKRLAIKRKKLEQPSIEKRPRTKTAQVPAPLPTAENHIDAESSSSMVPDSDKIKEATDRPKESSRRLFDHSKSPSGQSENEMSEPHKRVRRWKDPQSTAEEIEWLDSDDELNSKETAPPTTNRVLRMTKITKHGYQRRVKWSADETQWLVKGVKTYGSGNWATILKRYPFVNRTSVNLKDRWRNIQS